MPHNVHEVVIALVASGVVGDSSAAAEPVHGCVLTTEVRESVRDHNTNAKQEFEEKKYLHAALLWLAALALVPDDPQCAQQRHTRVDLAARSLRSYLDGLVYAPADASDLAELRRILEPHVTAELAGERRTRLESIVAELSCVLQALPDSAVALACTSKGRAAIPPQLQKPLPSAIFSPAPLAPRVPEPEQERLLIRRRGMATGLGISLGLGVVALGSGVGTWAAARTGGPLHREIQDAAADSVVDGDPTNDVPPNLPPERDYCVVARDVGNPALVNLCEHQGRVASGAIASFALTGVLAASSVVFGVLWGRTFKRADRVSRRLRFDLGASRSGATLSVAWHL